MPVKAVLVFSLVTKRPALVKPSIQGEKKAMQMLLKTGILRELDMLALRILIRTEYLSHCFYSGLLIK